MSETKSEKEMNAKKIMDCDPSYGMLDVCLDAFTNKRKMEDKSVKLI